MLTRNDILARQDLEREEVPIKEWGGSVWVRQLSGRELVKLQRLMSDNDDADLIPLVIWCTVDAEGEQLFTEEDAHAIAAKSSQALERIVTAALRINFLSDQADPKDS